MYQALGTAVWIILVVGLSMIALAPVLVQGLRAVQRRRRARRIAKLVDFHMGRVGHDESGLDDGLTEYHNKVDEQ